ncbi:hypothetical protein [Peptoanaerobacter stomatis]
MYRIIFIGILIIAFFLLYNILTILFNVESSANKRAFENSRIHKKKFVNPKYIFAKYIKISNYKKNELSANLYSLNMEITPEEFISQNIFNSIIFMPFIITFLSLKNYVLSVILLFLSIILFFDSMDKVNRMLAFRRIKIEEEAPNLIRYFIVSLKNTYDIKQIFENYIDIAQYLKRDIELTIVDMNSMRNNENNLVRSLELLDDRLNTPIMNDFITGLINVTMGKNQESYFSLLERELKDLSILNLERKSKKVEKSIRRYSYTLIVFFVIFAVTEFTIYIMSAFTF